MRLNRFTHLVLLVSFVLVAACGKEDAVPTSGAVGHVVVVEGDVRAQRGSEAARSVLVKDIVFADDTIVTGNESSVQILLTHNGALWELGANSERRIDKGIAFRAKTKGAGPLAQTEQTTTSAAGRGTTREAADSVGTLSRETADQTEAMEGDEGSSPSEGDGTVPARTAPDVYGDIQGGEAPAADAVADRPSDGQTDPMGRRKRPRENRQSGSQHQSKPMPPSKAPKNSSSGGGGGGLEIDDIFESPRPEPKAESSKDLGASDGPSSKGSALPSIKTSARKCHKQHGGTGTITFVLKANGSFAATAQHASLRQVASCLEKAVRSDGIKSESAIESSIRFE